MLTPILLIAVDRVRPGAQQGWQDADHGKDSIKENPNAALEGRRALHTVRPPRCFVKYALQHGFSLIPVYTFGESDTYWNAPGFWKFRWGILNDRKLPAIVPFGRWWFPLLPRPVELNTIGGEALKLPKIEKPTKEDVDKWHEAYVQHLKKHFNTYKKEFGGSEANSELEIW